MLIFDFGIICYQEAGRVLASHPSACLLGQAVLKNYFEKTRSFRKNDGQ